MRATLLRNWRIKTRDGGRTLQEIFLPVSSCFNERNAFCQSKLGTCLCKDRAAYGYMDVSFKSFLVPEEINEVVHLKPPPEK
jgi:hypothetical protein